MIEEVAKSIRRKQTVDEDYIEALYDKMSTLYHLNELSASVAGPTRIDFEGISGESVVLIASVAGAWLILGALFIFNLVKKIKKKNRY
jgi:multiple sugar transport system substrate-binding protein